MTVASRGSFNQALDVVRRFAAGHVKAAELGGAGNDIPFEQAMSNLAHAYMRDKAPSLLDHEQGFQLLERNADNTKAIGVLGFKVGSLQLYCPVFFIKGSLKGHELLYIQNQDMFIPLKENWLNYIMNRKPAMLGRNITRRSSQLGISGPSLDRLTRSPYKFASAVHPFFRESLPVFCHAACLDVGEELRSLGRDFDMPRFLKQASSPMLQSLVTTLQRYPEFAQCYADFNGLDDIATSVTAATSRQKIASVLDPLSTSGSVLDESKTAAAIRVIRFDLTQIVNSNDLTNEEREDAAKDGVLVRDNRDDADVSIPVNIRAEQILTNPTETGLYEVLVKPGEFQRCFVAISPMGPNGTQTFATVVRVAGDKDWLNTHPSRILVGSRVDGDDYRKWYDSLSTATSLTVNKSRHILIGPRGSVTLPFRVEKSLGDGRGGISYDVDFSDYCDYARAGHALRADDRPRWESTTGGYDKYRDGQRIRLNGKRGTQLRCEAGDVYVPEGFKILTVEAAAEDTLDSDIPISIDAKSHSENLPLRLGNLADAELELQTKTAAVRITNRGRDFVINGQSYLPTEAMIHLVCDHGLRKHAANDWLRQAEHGRATTFRIKYAGPYLSESAIAGPGFPDPRTGGGEALGYSGYSLPSQEDYLPVQDLSSSLTDRSVYHPSDDQGFGQADMQIIQRAMSTGQKDVFNTSVISSMLKSVRDDTMIDRYLPQLVKGMDSIGRILFFFYWRGDQFAERYGKADMPELEDSLRNTLEALGDVVLFLKQKTVEPYPEEGSTDIDLGQVAGA